MGALSCPFCSSADVERVGQWGGQIITAQWRCNACNSYFEAVREDFDDTPAPWRAPAPSSRST
jgi:transposase-like protein